MSYKWWLGMVHSSKHVPRINLFVQGVRTLVSSFFATSSSSLCSLNQSGTDISEASAVSAESNL